MQRIFPTDGMNAVKPQFISSYVHMNTTALIIDSKESWIKMFTWHGQIALVLFTSYLMLLFSIHKKSVLLHWNRQTFKALQYTWTCSFCRQHFYCFLSKLALRAMYDFFFFSFFSFLQNTWIFWRMFFVTRVWNRTGLPWISFHFI